MKLRDHSFRASCAQILSAPPRRREGTPYAAVGRSTRAAPVPVSSLSKKEARTRQDE
jgi:hypothetical protein